MPMTDLSQHAPAHSTPDSAVAALAEPLAASLGLSLWGVEIAFGPRSLVRVYVDSEAEGGVTVEDCAKLSRLLGLSLEVEEVFPGAYVLEVSSPGLERSFFTQEQLARHAGQVVDLTLKIPDEAFLGRRKFKGLLGLPDAQNPGGDIRFTLAVDDPCLPEESDGILHFTFADLKKAKLVHIVPEKTLPGKKKKNNSQV